jgi:RNA polymerase sigma-70 factor (ECF subfamily)
MPMVAIDDDEDAVTPSVAGDAEAFETLIRENQRMIHSLCYRMTGSIADAQDLAQETFIQAYRHLAEFRGEARVSSWLYRIAMNQCLNWQKSRQRRERLYREWSEQELDATPKKPDPRTHAVQEALLSLNPKQRAAIVLTVHEGLTHADAARALGCSETTVSWRLFAARRKLKRLLSKRQKSGDAND